VKSTVLFGHYLEIAAYVAIWWREVESAFIEVVLLGANNLWTVELGQDGEKCASIPVVRNSTAVVTFSRQVRQSNVLYVLQNNQLQTCSTSAQNLLRDLVVTCKQVYKQLNWMGLFISYVTQ